MTTENMCKKRQYATEAEAVAFSESWAIKHPNSVRQHPYRCEDCSNCYHLTTQSSESYGLARSHQMIPPKLGNTREDVAYRRRMVLQQRNQGKNARAISAALGIAIGVVYADFQVLNASEKPQKPLVTVDSLLQQKKAIEAEIERLRQQEAATIAAKRFQFLPRTDGDILICKDSQKMHLRSDDAYELVDRLTEYLTALPATVPSRQ
jgi:hypothetical protein